MTTAIKFCGDPRVNYFLCFVKKYKPSGKHKYVCIIMLAGESGNGFRGAKCRTYAVYFIRHNAHTNAASANKNSSIAFPFCYCFCCGKTDIRVIR